MESINIFYNMGNNINRSFMFLIWIISTAIVILIGSIILNKDTWLGEDLTRGN